MSNNYKKINLKRKVFVRGQKNFKRFKKTPKYIRDNPENIIAREKERDAYHFTDSEDEPLDDLGMGLDLDEMLQSDDDDVEDKQKKLIALTQDSVRPLFSSDSPYDESKLDEGLAELRLSAFRPNQKEAIKRILHGRSTLFISPTGSGKSLCYLLPALLYWRYRKYMTVVVSPLISLMEDQMNNLPPSLKAVSLHSGHNRTQRRRSIELLAKGDAQVAFISPEAIVGGVLDLEDLKNLPPVGFVCIDEAHCLSEWSHNFRPAYQQFFKILSEQMNIKTYLGLTATATKATSFAIARSLIINPEYDVIGSTTIPQNLILSVSYETNKERALIDLLKTPTFRIMTSIIVYCNRREETEHVASRIRTAMQNYSTLVEVPERIKSSNTSKNDSISSNGSNSSSISDKEALKLSWHAEPYHAGLSTETRKRIQRQFIKGELRVVVATIAFGMGINKANVRAIIHYDMPSSFESYVQEIGRAGRDGKPAQCHMFLKADKSDLFYQQRNIYSCITERKNLKKLSDYLFKSCRCTELATEEDLEKVEKLNRLDPHEVSNWHKTNFTDIAVQDPDDELDDLASFENVHGEKENGPTRYVRKSIVKKHRLCKGHELAFDIEEATNEINLKPESIITLICQLQKAYPQLHIEQYTPIKSTCNLYCSQGKSQMESLAKTSRPVEVALNLHRRQQMKTRGVKGETPTRLSFDVINVARILAKPYVDVVRMLKRTEWELVQKTGQFRKSQVRVSYEGNSFHLKVVGDLNDKELEEVNTFLYDFTSLYESVERDKIANVYNTLKKFSIDVEKMQDKTLRLETSHKLKAALNAYFDHSSDSQVATTNEGSNQLSELNIEQRVEDQTKLSQMREESIRKSARAFVSAHGKNFTPRTIARIFQGISTPKYPSEHWGPNKKWWRIHLDVDFLQLSSIIQEELLR